MNEQPIYGSLSAAVAAITTSTSRIVFLMAQASTAGLILREAYARGVFGATSGFVWFLTDGGESSHQSRHLNGNRLSV